jgi:transcriptional regulator with XRE-family HTH domain
MTFGKKLKKLLEEKDITQTELAKMLNCRQSIISRWIKEVSSNPKKETIDKLAKTLQVPPSYFIEGQKNFIENRGIIGDNNSNNFNADLKDFKIQLQDHEIRILKLENEILRKELKK